MNRSLFALATGADRARIIEHAARARLPAIYQWSQSAEEGGLMAYGPRGTPMDLQLAARGRRSRSPGRCRAPPA